MAHSIPILPRSSNTYALALAIGVKVLERIPKDHRPSAYHNMRSLLLTTEDDAGLWLNLADQLLARAI